MSRINVTIDRLVLKGLDPAARTALVRGLRSELEQMLSDPSQRAALSSRGAPVLRMRQMHLKPGIAGAHDLGKSVARAVGKGGKR